MFSLTLTKVLLTSLGCGLVVKQVAYDGVFSSTHPLFALCISSLEIAIYLDKLAWSMTIEQIPQALLFDSNRE